MSARPTTAAVGGEHQVPVPDDVARDYILLALRLDQLSPGLVDGYFGPADLKAQVELEQRPAPARLAEDAEALRSRVAADVREEDRRDWLELQLAALEAQARQLAGDDLPYTDLVERLFAWLPTRRPDSLFELAAAEVDGLLPGDRPLDARLAAWDEQLVVAPDRLPAVVDWLVGILRERAAMLFGLPSGETLKVSMVRKQPWSAYNWYDGGLRSRVDINLDLPVRAFDLLRTVAHETYPGHHLEHAWKEADLVVSRGRVESSVLLINTPECLISEGLGNLGAGLIAPRHDATDLVVELFTRAGLPFADDDAAVRSAAERALALEAPRRRLGEIVVNAALLRHADGWSHQAVAEYMRNVGRMAADRVEKGLEFIEHPLWRTYIFVYSEGEALLARWLEQVPEEERRNRFARLLHEQLTPRAIDAELRATD